MARKLSQIVGHPVIFKKGIVGLIKRGCWEIPDVLASSFMAIVGMGMAAAGIYYYKLNDGENREYKSVYYIVRAKDPRACNLKNPARSEYKC